VPLNEGRHKDLTEFKSLIPVYKISADLVCEQAPDRVIREGKNRRAEIAESGLKGKIPPLQPRFARPTVFFSRWCYYGWRDWKGLGRARLGGLPNFKFSKQSEMQRWKKHRLRSLKPPLFSFLQANDFAQRTTAVIRLLRRNMQIISERKRMPYTLYHNNLIDEIYIFRDKYLKEYRVKNTNINTQRSKIASYSYPDTKHLD